MRKIIQILFSVFAFVSIIQAAPITVTLNVPGGFVRTDRWEDPSTCRTFDRIVCNQNSGICYILTYTYDDGTLANNGTGLVEGDQIPPVHVILTNPQGEVINEGIVSSYQDYALPESPNLYAAFEYTFEECGN